MRNSLHCQNSNLEESHVRKLIKHVKNCRPLIPMSQCHEEKLKSSLYKEIGTNNRHICQMILLHNKQKIFRHFCYSELEFTCGFSIPKMTLFAWLFYDSKFCGPYCTAMNQCQYHQIFFRNCNKEYQLSPPQVCFAQIDVLLIEIATITEWI